MSDETPTERFTAVPLEELESWKRSTKHRGRVSYPLLKQFMELGHAVAKLNRDGMQQSTQTLSSCLNSYAKNHDIPVKVSMRGGELYLVRTDLDDQGNPLKIEPEPTDAPRLDKAAVDARVGAQA